MGDTSRVAAVAVGVVTLHFEGGKILVLDDCLYVPDVRRNLISIFCLSCNRYSSFFNKNSVFIKFNDDIICSGMLHDRQETKIRFLLSFETQRQSFRTNSLTPEKSRDTTPTATAATLDVSPSHK